MDEWIDGWMRFCGVWMNGSMDGWMDEWINGSMDGSMDG
jgi:hypothetical protein